MVTHACNLNCVYCFEKFKSSARMDLSTAMEAVLREIEFVENHPEIGYIIFDLFGGEPLMNFDLIRELVEWAERQSFETDCRFSVTTNGTLLDTPKKSWFRRHKKTVRLILSVDGKEEMNRRNRGRDVNDLPIDFVMATWPESHLKMTVSHDTLPNFAEGMIWLHEQGFRVSGSLAVGEPWQEGDAELYREQLRRLGAYYLAHRSVTPAPIFNRLFAEMLDANRNVPLKNCGAGTSMLAYDVDGRTYPCHMFVPVVHGREVCELLREIDFSDHEALTDPDCKSCGVLRVCRTCYGFNYNQRGDAARRDRSACRMFLVEAQEISAFQIRHLMEGTPAQDPQSLMALKAALRCYQTYRDYVFPSE